MRSAPTVLHLDMDAFYASVEQEAKPSLRGRPVVVGGTGPRGVVATASYEARVFGVHSAMPVAQARRLCPNAAYLHPRFSLYREISEQVMALLGELSPLVEPLSLDEAFVDLAAGGVTTAAEARRTAHRVRERIRQATTLPSSVGLAGSKMLAKIASEAAKPDGLLLLVPGTEERYLAPLPARVLPGVGPATEGVLRRAGIVTAGEAVRAGHDALVQLLGQAHGTLLHRLARGVDDRPVVAERDAKSVSEEDTFAEDLVDRGRVRAEADRLAVRCVARLRGAGRSGRTVVLKVRAADFTTVTRSETLRGPTDDPTVVREAAARLLEGVDTRAGVRLLGVGVSGLADFTQEDLFAQAAEAASAVLDPEPAADGEEGAARAGRDGGPDEPGGPSGTVAGGGDPPTAPGPDHPAGGPPDAASARRWLPGGDVRHPEHGPGWVQGSGLGRVTVRFERPGSRPGRVRTFDVTDPLLRPADPLPLRPDAGGGPVSELPALPPPPASPLAGGGAAGHSVQPSGRPPEAASSDGPAS